MVERRRKKKNRLRGHRTHGKGDTKNKRGAGSRGGRGRAGSHKHKFNLYSGSFGKEKKTIKATKVVIAVNLEEFVQELPKLVEEKIVEKQANAFIVDGKKLDFDKILSRGSLKEKLVVTNLKTSAKAKEKILAAGGKVEEPEDIIEETVETKEEKKGEQ